MRESHPEKTEPPSGMSSQQLYQSQDRRRPGDDRPKMSELFGGDDQATPALGTQTSEKSALRLRKIDSTPYGESFAG